MAVIGDQVIAERLFKIIEQHPEGIAGVSLKATYNRANRIKLSTDDLYASMYWLLDFQRVEKKWSTRPSGRRKSVYRLK